MATHSSILAWEISWTEEPGRLSPWVPKVRHNLATEHAHTYLKTSLSIYLSILLILFLRRTMIQCALFVGGLGFFVGRVRSLIGRQKYNTVQSATFGFLLLNMGENRLLCFLNSLGSQFPNLLKKGGGA